MSTMIAEIITRLETDPAIVALFGTRIYTREIKSSGPGATPDAFGVAGHMRTSLRVIDHGDAQSQAAIIGAAPHSFQAFPLIYLYDQAVETGKANIREAKRLIRLRLNGYRWIDDGGMWSEIAYLDSWGIHDSDEFPGAVYDYVRLQVRGHHQVS
jgi:hypothetical protein